MSEIPDDIKAKIDEHVAAIVALANQMPAQSPEDWAPPKDYAARYAASEILGDVGVDGLSGCLLCQS